MLRLVAASLFVLSLAASGFPQTVAPSSLPQQQTQAGVSAETARGIELYRQGNMRAAIEALRAVTRRNRNDADAWHYLGRAFSREDRIRDARRAFEQAVRLRPDFAAAHTGLAFTLLLANDLVDAEREARRALELNAQDAEAHYVLGVLAVRGGSYQQALAEAEAALGINPNLVPALLLKTHALINGGGGRGGLAEAASSLERYLQLNPNADDTAFWREQLEALRAHASLAVTIREANNDASRANEARTRVRMISRTYPGYTEAARQAGISGTVRLRVLVTADGRVEHVLVVQPLSHGLTGAAVRAARGIRFEPATRNGRPVSTFVTLEESFSIHSGRVVFQ